jgi:uncharacterized protein (DUF3084 family)
MNPHRTTNPAKRAEHIADREEKLHEQELMRKTMEETQFFLIHEYEPGVATHIYQDWPKYWLDTYHNTLPLLAEPSEK